MYKRVIWTLCLLAAATTTLSAESFSYTGTLATPEDVFQTTFTLTSAGSVTIQTWGFGGGTNAAGTQIQSGGFDPLIALFSGPTSTIVTDAFGDPLADADNLSNPPWSYVGNCPAAGTVNIGGSSDCGDVFLQASLAAGTYTLLLTDANYLPFALFDDGDLSEGFVDFTAGVFRTCDPNSQACISPKASYAVDILTSESAPPPPPAVTPDPSTFLLFGTGLAALAGARRFTRKK